MSKVALALAAAFLAVPRQPVVLSAPAGVEGYNQRSSDVIPPPRFRYDSTTKLVTINTQAVMDQDCGVPEKGRRLACTRGTRRHPVVFMPNPCDFPDERYAHLLCHELGHVQGWGADHEP